jgi:hypothetical protein
MSTGFASVEQRRAERPLMAITGLAAAAGVALQLYLAFTSARYAGVAATTVRYLSYFTILSNVMVALTCGHALLGSSAGFLGRPTVRAAIVVYIVVTGVVYAVLLGPHIVLQGPYVWSNALLHDVTPILYPLVWGVFGAHGRLRWGDASRWLIVPLVYMVWTLARGAVTDVYPYDFVDVSRFGMSAVLRNALGLCAAFLVLGLVVVAIDRALGRRRAA